MFGKAVNQSNCYRLAYFVLYNDYPTLDHEDSLACVDIF
jgi:hypothetical protein